MLNIECGLRDPWQILASVDMSFPQHVREVMGKDTLRSWASLITQRHHGGRKVDNFVESWKDGIAFWALLAHTQPQWRDFGRELNTEASCWIGNLQSAFRGFATMGVPQLLDASEVSRLLACG